MFIVDFFKTMSAVKKANNFVKEHENTVNTVKGLIAKAQNAVNWLENHKTAIEIKIAKVKEDIAKLKGFINK